MGRKALSDSEKKSKVIIIRLTEAEYKQVDEKAWASRRSKSEFARDAINRYLNSADSDKDRLPFQVIAADKKGITLRGAFFLCIWINSSITCIFNAV